jgi:hypothetical protein
MSSRGERRVVDCGSVLDCLCPDSEDLSPHWPAKAGALGKGWRNLWQQ